MPADHDPAVLMDQTLAMARAALDAGDHPYGAVLVGAAGHVAERNRVVSTSDPTAHAETMAIRTAAAGWGIPALAGSTMYASFEPCPMCFGAILEAGVTTLMIGARRTVGDAPLGEYTVEALASLTGRTGEIAVVTHPHGSAVTDFYASVG